AQDATPTLPVIQHAIEFFNANKELYDTVCLLQATSPLRPTGFIDRALEVFKTKKADSLVSVLKVPHEYNPHWTFEADEDGVLKIATGENILIPRRQELPVAYHRDGAIYLTRT